MVACKEGAEWVDRIRRGLSELPFLASEPARRLRDGAPPAAGLVQPLPTTDEAVIGGVASLLGHRVLAGEASTL